MMKEHYLTLLRNRETDTAEFRYAAGNLASLIAQEISLALPLKSRKIHTPMGETAGGSFNKKVILVPILRAGLAFLPSFLALFREASIGFLGIRRDEKDARPHLYYENLPQIRSDDYVFLLDPMLATGGTANLALDKLAEKGAAPIHTLLATFLSAKPGIEAIEARHPHVKIFTAATDPHLDAKKFIVPGLGDFGNRYFGT